MLTSRGLCLLRTIALVSRKNVAQNLQQVRREHVWSYRVAGEPPSKSVFLAAEIGGGIFWWWVLWHLWHEHEHITGEFEYPDPTKWTDAELGIPPDDADD